MSFLLRLLLLLLPLYSSAEVFFAQVGNSVTIPRETWGEQSEVYVNWKFKDEDLISRNPRSSSPKQAAPNWQGRLFLSEDFSLIISPVQETDFGTFICEQHELMKGTTNTYELYQVKMSTSPPLLANDTLSLSCEIDLKGFNLVRTVFVRWLGPDNKPYPGNSSGNNYTLSVTKVFRGHSGKWICEVKYGSNHILRAGTDVIIVDLSPSPPEPIYTSDSTNDFTIPCSLSSKIPWAKVNATGVTGGSWSFISSHSSESFPHLLKLQPNPYPVWKSPNGPTDFLMESEVKNHELSVKIPKVSIKHRGTFTCSLEFGSSRTLSSNVNIEVLQVISSAGKVLNEGDALNLTCMLGHPMPSDLEVKWKPPYGLSLPNLSPTHPTELLFSEVNLKDKGRWACELRKNVTVLATATITLKIEKATVDIWLVAIIGGLLGFILLVIAIFLILRHRKVMKYTQRKRRYCCCKNPQPKGFYRT